MDGRTQGILSTVVREYIRRAEPIGSEWLAESFNFGIAAATMRQELARLDESGYLMQPHTSAGRVPTDKGYRFFVNLLLVEERRGHERLLQAMLRQAEAFERERQDIMRAAAQWLGEHSRNLGMVGLSGGEDGVLRRGSGQMLYAFGFKQLLRQPELGDVQYLAQAFSLFESIEERIADLVDRVPTDATSVFIGRENPLREARQWSMVVGQFERAGGPGMVAIAGPTRMDYDRNIALVEAMRQFLTANQELRIRNDE
ncbi:hypothetical protein HYZ80_01545 [Candidatus Parcubacteria bacterium]|nr:hypothetical protein [Candidatus Parcubacteria bacterium]